MTVAKIIINGSTIERLSGMSMLGRLGGDLIYNRDGQNISVDLNQEIDLEAAMNESKEETRIDTDKSHIERHKILSETDSFPEIEDGTYPLILREKNGMFAFRLNPISDNMCSMTIRNSEGKAVSSFGSNITSFQDWNTLPVGSKGSPEYDSEYTINITNSSLEIKIVLTDISTEDSEDSDNNENLVNLDDLGGSEEFEEKRSNMRDEINSRDPESLVNHIKKAERISDVDHALDSIRDERVNFDHEEFNTVNDIHEKFRLMNECSSYKRMAKYLQQLPEEGNLRALATTFMINNIIERSNTSGKKPFENICRNLMNIRNEHFLHSGNITRRVDIRIIDPLMNHLNSGFVQARYDELADEDDDVDPSKVLGNCQPPELLDIDRKIMDIFNNSEVQDPKEKASNSTGNQYLDADNPSDNNNSVVNKSDSQLDPVELKTRDINKFMRQARTTKELLEFIENGSRAGWKIDDPEADVDDVKKTIKEIKNIASNNSVQELGSKVKKRFPSDTRNIRTMINTFVVSQLAREYMHDIQNDKMRKDTINRYNKYSKGLEMSPDQIEIYKKNKLSEFIDILDPNTPENTKLDPKSEIVRRSFSMVEFQESKGDKREIQERGRQNIDPYSGIQKSEVSEGVIDRSTSGNLPEDIGAIEDIDTYRKSSLLVDYSEDEIEQKLVHSVSVDPKIGDSDDTFSDLAEHLKNIHHGTENFGDSVQRLENKATSYEQNALEVLSYYTLSNIIRSSPSEKSATSAIENVRDITKGKLTQSLYTDIDLMLESINSKDNDTNISRIPEIVKEEIERFNDVELETEESQSTEFNFIGVADENENIEEELEIQKDDIEEDVMESLLSEQKLDDMKQELKSRIGDTTEKVKLSNITIGNINMDTFFEKLAHKDGANPKNTLVKNDTPTNLSHIALVVEMSKLLDQYQIVTSSLERDLHLLSQRVKFAIEIHPSDSYTEINDILNTMYGANIDEDSRNYNVTDYLLSIKESENSPAMLRRTLDDYNIGDEDTDEVEDREDDVEVNVESILSDWDIDEQDVDQENDIIELDNIEEDTINAIMNEDSVEDMKVEARRRFGNQEQNADLENIKIDGIQMKEFFNKLDDINQQDPNTTIKSEYNQDLSNIAFAVEVSKIIDSQIGFNQKLIDDLSEYKNKIDGDLIDVKNTNPYKNINEIVRQTDDTPEEKKNQLDMIRKQPETPSIISKSVSKLFQRSTESLGDESEDSPEVVEASTENNGTDNEFI